MAVLGVINYVRLRPPYPQGLTGEWRKRNPCNYKNLPHRVEHTFKACPPSAGDFYVNGPLQPSRYSAACTLQAQCLNCGDRNGVDDVLNGGTARQVVHGLTQTLQNRAHSGSTPEDC